MLQDCCKNFARFTFKFTNLARYVFFTRIVQKLFLLWTRVYRIFTCQKCLFLDVKKWEQKTSIKMCANYKIEQAKSFKIRKHVKNSKCEWLWRPWSIRCIKRPTNTANRLKFFLRRTRCSNYFTHTNATRLSAAARRTFRHSRTFPLQSVILTRKADILANARPSILSRKKSVAVKQRFNSVTRVDLFRENAAIFPVYWRKCH